MCCKPTPSAATVLWICPLVFVSFLDAVIYYEWFVPEAERRDSALKRNKEALITELKLWEGYLQKVGERCKPSPVIWPHLPWIFGGK